MPGRNPPHGPQHPEEYRGDLHPDAGSDDNVLASQAELNGYRTAYEMKDVHDRLQNLNDDELRRIPIVPEGTRLRQGATYTDLSMDRPREFTATAEMTAGREQRLTSKDDVDHELWNTLVGHTDRPRRGDI